MLGNQGCGPSCANGFAVQSILVAMLSPLRPEVWKPLSGEESHYRKGRQIISYSCLTAQYASPHQSSSKPPAQTHQYAPCTHLQQAPSPECPLRATHSRSQSRSVREDSRRTMLQRDCLAREM